VRPDWKPPKRELNRDLMRRLHMDGGECCVCGRTWSAELHHLKRRSQGGGDTCDNLAWLCHEHHFKYHAATLSSSEKALIRPIEA
jgi:5-methylcytosine-specific restriction endonuclease McrA